MQQHMDGAELNHRTRGTVINVRKYGYHSDIQCGAIITQSFFSPKPHKRLQIACPLGGGMGCLLWPGSNFDLFSATVIAVMYATSCYIGSHLKGTLLYWSSGNDKSSICFQKTKHQFRTLLYYIVHSYVGQGLSWDHVWNERILSRLKYNSHDQGLSLRGFSIRIQFRWKFHFALISILTKLSL